MASFARGEPWTSSGLCTDTRAIDALAFNLPTRAYCANPAVAVAGEAAIFVRLEEKGVDHAVAEEWEVRALRVELRIGPVAVISAGQRVWDTSLDPQIEIILAPHRARGYRSGWNGSSAYRPRRPRYTL